MIVFNSFFRILKKYGTIILLFTIMLLFFGAFSLQNNSSTGEFSASKPDVFVQCEDSMQGITKNLYDYLAKYANIKEINNDEQSISDALFYRDIDSIITIPTGYRQDYLAGKNPTIQVKHSTTSGASYAQMLIETYLKVANVYQNQGMEEQEIINNINKVIEKEVTVDIASTLDTTSLSKAAFYFNFANYAIMAACVYVIAIILTSFKKISIHKRTTISSMKYTSYNKQLFMGNLVFALALWLCYIIIGIVLIPQAMLSMHGLLFAMNFLAFTICSVSIGFLIANIITDKEAIMGIVNVISLGSSFLCGAFVPVEFLPAGVLKIAQVLPSYWYIQNNELLKMLEEINLETLTPYLINIGIVLVFTIVFIGITNVITSKKRKIG